MKTGLVYIYVTPFFPEPGRHYGSYGYDFVQALKRNSDYDVRVFVPGKGNDYDFEGCHVYRFPVRHLPSALFPFLFTRLNTNSFVGAVRRAGIDIDDVAVCHGNTATYSIYPLAIKKLNPRCLTILHHHDLDGYGLRLGMFRHVWIHKLINFFIIRRLFELMDLHVFISEASKKSTLLFPDTSWSCYGDYRRLGRGLGWLRPANLKQTLVLWNGVDTSKFNKNGRPSRNEGAPFVIGCIGNFIEVKNQMGLVRAVDKLRNRIPNLKLEFCGDNGYSHVLNPIKYYIIARHLESIVSILPCVPHNQLPKVYRHWDLFVLPSYFEGLGCVYLESWACGTPFIGCLGQGIEDCIPANERDLWLAAPLNVEDLAAKIYAYHHNQYSQHLSSDIDIDRLVAQYVRYLDGVRS